LLAVRISSDEAAGALISSQFFVWVFRKVWSHVAPFWARVEGLRRALTPVLAVILVGLVVAQQVGLIPPSTSELGRGLLVGTLLVFGVAAMCVGLAAYVALVLMLLMHVPVGLDAMMASLYVYTAAEPTPPGQATVFHVVPRDTSPAARLHHSELYDHPEVVACVASWIRTRFEADAV
jgi:hypothetical protein